jgi:hypothetical protein
VALFAPFIAALKWIPLFGYFLGTAAKYVVDLFCLVYVPMFQLSLTALAMIFYRPMMGALLFSICAALLAVMFLVNPGSDEM